MQPSATTTNAPHVEGQDINNVDLDKLSSQSRVLPVVTQQPTPIAPPPNSTTTPVQHCIKCGTTINIPMGLSTHASIRHWCGKCFDGYYTGGVSYINAQGEVRPSNLIPAATSPQHEESIKAAVARELFQQPQAPIVLVANKQLVSYITNPQLRYVIATKQLAPGQSFDYLKHTLSRKESIVINFIFDVDHILRPAQSLETSNIQLCLTLYKSTQGKKQLNPHRLKVELYVDQNLWETVLSASDRNALKYAQVLVEDHLHGNWPEFRLSGERNSVSVALCYQDEHISIGSFNFVQRRWYFPINQVPDEVLRWYHSRPPFNPVGIPANAVPFGVTTIYNLFSEETLLACEAHIDALIANIHNLGPNTVDLLVLKNTVKRYKFFFHHRYAYGRHVAGPTASAYGIEATRDAIPPWVQGLIEDIVVNAGILPVGFVNSACINVYKGSGLHSHIDDPQRFARGIYSLRLFGDSRLTFGAHGLGMNNALCCVPMPRGSVTILDENSYAADAVTHCVRHQDVKVKSAAVLLRFMKSV